MRSASLYVHATGSNGSILARNNSMPARPYMARLSVFKRLICPSAWQLLHGSAMAFLTVSMSRIRLRANCCIERTLECLGSSSQRSGLPGSSPSRRPRKSGDPPTPDQTRSRTPSMWIEHKPTNRAVERRLRVKFARTHSLHAARDTWQAICASSPSTRRTSARKARTAPPWWGRSCRLKARGAAPCTSSRATCRLRSSMTAASFWKSKATASRFRQACGGRRGLGARLHSGAHPLSWRSARGGGGARVEAGKNNPQNAPPSH